MPGTEAKWLFAAGLAVIPAFLFQESTLVHAAQVLLAWLCARMLGKRIQLWYFFLLTASIAAFQVLIPSGRILVALGPVLITDGALLSGLHKGLTISGLVFISLATVRSDLRLPGTFGALMGKVFLYFEQILAEKKRLRRHELIASLDEVLFHIFVPGVQSFQEQMPVKAAQPSAQHPSRLSAAVLTAWFLVLVQWGLLLLPANLLP